MKNIIIPWLPLKDMVVLDILSQTHMPAKEDFLWTLRQSPALEVLSIFLGEEFPQAAVIPADHVSDNAVHLLRLRELRLGSFGSNQDVLYFLSRLIFPSSASVDLCLFGQPPENVCLGDICPPIRAVQARVIKGSIRFEYLYTIYNVVLQSLDSIFRIEWERGLLWEAHSDAHMKNALNSISLPSLQSLAILASRYNPSYHEWMDLLRRIPTLHRLEVDFRSDPLSSGWLDSGSAFFDALGELGEHEVDGEVPVVCPRLAQLVIKRATSNGVAQTEVWEALRRALLSRARKGAPKLELLDFVKGEDQQELTLPEDVPVDRLAELVERITIQHDE